MRFTTITYVVPNDSIFNENTTTFTVDIYCLDIIQKDRSNINTILSDTNTILSDLKKWILDGEVYSFDVINNPTATPLNNALLDYCAGWSMTLEVDCPTYGVCEIPFIENPVIINEVNNIIYPKLLTCESLAECSTIIDIENELSSLTETVNDIIENKISKHTGTTYTTNSIQTVSQAEYDAILVKDATTIYFIV